MAEPKYDDADAPPAKGSSAPADDRHDAPTEWEADGAGRPRGSFIRSTGQVDASGGGVPALQADAGVDDGPVGFLDEWAMRHFSISVKIHDVERVGEHDAERRLVLQDLSLVQGVLLELHDFASADRRVRALMDRGPELQNGVSALYTWLEEVLDAAGRLRVTRGRPSFVDGPDEDVFKAILRSLERVHPDLEALLRVEALGVDPDVAQKLALCFRQIGAAVVRVSGRTVSSYPARDR